MTAMMTTEELVSLISRRAFLRGASALAAAPLFPNLAFALAQTAHTFKQGDFEVTVVSDGSLVLPLNVMAPEATPEQLAEIAKRLGWASGNAEPKANVPVIKAGSDLIMFDNGSAGNFGPTAGKLAENLAGAGIDPKAITKVVFTHAHPDHLGATLTKDGGLLCPNAAYYAGGAEWDFWMSPEIFNQLPKEMHVFAQGAQAAFGAVKDKVTMLKGGDEVVPGIKALDTPGHTPGHLSFEIAGGEGLIITGDASTNEIVSFEHPDWKFGFDADPAMAIKNRTALIDRAAADKIKLLGFHWAYPGVGFAEKSGTAYKYAAAS
jgi:glyoxylase-like metal-dependent hydrolase (beta-lactamase superfamily II)